MGGHICPGPFSACNIGVATASLIENGRIRAPLGVFGIAHEALELDDSRVRIGTRLGRVEVGPDGGEVPVLRRLERLEARIAKPRSRAHSAESVPG